MVFTCQSCKRNFTTQRGLNIHRTHCKSNTLEIIHRNNCFIDANFDDQLHEPEMETSLIVNMNELNINIERVEDDNDIPNEVISFTVNSDNLAIERNECNINTPNLPDLEVHPTTDRTVQDVLWDNMHFSDLVNVINTTYEEIVKYRRNLFKIPSGKSGKMFIEELTFWLRQFNASSKLNSIALKAFMILPSLMLQKPSARSKSKEHSECLIRRLELWKKGDINKILREVRYIQSKFVSSKKARPSEDTSRIFAKLIMEGKISAALKFLDAESSSGVLKLTDKVIEELKTKHPNTAPIRDNSLLFGPIELIPKCFF